MPKTISIEEVRHLAQLSRLVVNAEEEKLFSRQFADILGHVEILARIETDDVEPLYSPILHPGWLRDDIECDIRTRAEILANAPETDGESFVVPRIV